MVLHRFSENVISRPFEAGYGEAFVSLHSGHLGHCYFVTYYNLRGQLAWQQVNIFPDTHIVEHRRDGPHTNSNNYHSTLNTTLSESCPDSQVSIFAEIVSLKIVGVVLEKKIKVKANYSYI